MTRQVVVLRPEPGNRATIERLRAADLPAIALPLFEVTPIAWTPPDPAAFDRLLLTSANVLRHGGVGLNSLHELPVIAVGGATAAAARTAGFAIDATGRTDLAALLEQIPSDLRLLWLSGEYRTAIDHPSIVRTIPVYRASARSLAAAQVAMLSDSVALVHSARAAARLAALTDEHGIPRNSIRIAAISEKTAIAAGTGWADVSIASEPNDDALIAAARPLAIDPRPQRENNSAMISEAPPSAPSRGNPFTLALIAGLIAFLLGLAVMAAIFRFGGWWQPSAAEPPTRPGFDQPAPPPGTDIATLAAREQALATRLDALDARLRASDGDARVAASYAGRAEAMMLVSSARRSIERGQPLGFVDRELHTRFGEIAPDAVATISRAGREPVTLDDLRFALDQIAPRLSIAAPGSDWLDGIRRELSSLVIVRKESAPSRHPRERLIRARRLLAQGHVEAALAEIARLPGAQGAESWMAAAGRYVAARNALDTLEAVAVQGRVQPVAGARPSPPQSSG